MSEKIQPHHLQRKAVLYIRQSSVHQVIHNSESRSLQYAMRERLAVLGWSDIEIIDDDLGISAAGKATRAGFERMVAEVCLGNDCSPGATTRVSPGRQAAYRRLRCSSTHRAGVR